MIQFDAASLRQPASQPGRWRTRPTHGYCGPRSLVFESYRVISHHFTHAVKASERKPIIPFLVDTKGDMHKARAHRRGVRTRHGLLWISARGEHHAQMIEMQRGLK